MSTFTRADGAIVCEYSEIVQKWCAHCKGVQPEPWVADLLNDDETVGD